MKQKKLIFSIVLAIAALLPAITAAEPPVHATGEDSIRIANYERRLEKRLNNWKRLIPTTFPLQYAGGMGMFSAGPGWAYGRGHKFETHLLLGFIPKRYNRSFYWTLSLREMYIPWRIKVGKSPIEIRPLTVSFSLSSILHHDFWTSQPERYPKGYYYFLSTRVRAFIGMGQRFSYNIPTARRFMCRRISFYYEVSICDMYLRQKFMHHDIPFGELLTLGVGLIYTI